jgi:hypothetical protein
MTVVDETAIFDATSYDLPIPSQDGHKADRLAISFSGGVELDRTSEEDLALVDELTLGKEVTLSVTAIVTKKGFTLTAGRDETPETTGYGVGLKVNSIEVQ